jgi:hypothetical protein
MKTTYIVQEWNKSSGWYDLPEGRDFLSESLAANLLAGMQRSADLTKSKYKYRLIRRTEEILCGPKQRVAILSLASA